MAGADSGRARRPRPNRLCGRGRALHAHLDADLARLSAASNGSRLWLAFAAMLSLTGRARRRSALHGVVAIGLTSAVTNLLVKLALRRRRPDRAGVGVQGTWNVRRPASRSFPSGHAASASAFATVVGHELPWAAVPLRLLASAVAYSRVHNGMHYPGDVVAGTLLGASWGHLVTSLTARRSKPRPSSARAG